MNLSKIIENHIEHNEITNLLSICLDRNQEENLTSNLNNLYSHILRHFEHEEEFMRLINYPSTDNHIQIHNRLKEELAKIITCSYLNILEKETLIKGLRVTISDHMKISDKAVADYVNNILIVNKNA